MEEASEVHVGILTGNDEEEEVDIQSLLNVEPSVNAQSDPPDLARDQCKDLKLQELIVYLKTEDLRTCR